MEYKYAKSRLDYSDLASGRVFYSLPGHPAFPVRLASEIFQHCMVRREKIYKNSTPCVLYDPCCGAAYHLSVLAYLHGEHIRQIIASDIDEKAVALAKRNLGLLTLDGLENRVSELSKMLELYNKDSHKAALDSSNIIKNRISVLNQEHPIATKVFQASATDGHEHLKNIQPNSVDVVFTDVPYGQNSYWQDTNSQDLSNPLWSMLNKLISILSPSSIVAVVSDKQQKVSHPGFQRIEHFQTGKRRIIILKPA